MKKIVYVHNKCTTCQSALRFLENKDIPVIIKDITKEPPSIKELEKMLAFQNGNIKKLLNTSGQLYREMELSNKLENMPLNEVLTLLSKHGMLVKRPFLLGDDFGLTGFKESDWAQKI